MPERWRHVYLRWRRFPPTFRVFVNHERIGMVERTAPPVEGKRKWRATLDRDPLIEGFGRTRDAAVEDAIAQVGGLG